MAKEQVTIDVSFRLKDTGGLITIIEYGAKLERALAALVAVSPMDIPEAIEANLLLKEQRAAGVTFDFDANQKGGSVENGAEKR